MRIAIFDPFSGIAGDMTLGALLQVGLDADWLRALPSALALPDVGVQIREVVRGEIVCMKVDFDIPPQPHGRHIKEIRALVEQSGAPERVRRSADAAFTAIATAEGEIHGMPPDEVHLHEVGAVDAILDVVGSIWGLEQLGVERVYCGTIALGDGSVKAAHGVLPVPAPATLKLLEGHAVRPGPENSGELVTPTGAALMRVLSAGPPPSIYRPLSSGFGAGTKDFVGRANALRVVLAESIEDLADGSAVEDLAELVCDVDDMSAELLAAAVERVRAAGALDASLTAITMKRGRAGTRIDVLCRPADAMRIEDLLLETTTIGVRARAVRRRALPRSVIDVTVLGHAIRAKVVTLPGGARRAKPELSDIERVALATGRPLQDISRLAAI
ncbi:MAG TPA: nickel pincer cofactor biosynthesis protein LarC, partial [Gemmatimonadaceae bacterium]|nr:nickel pincer cofactor biosynthesis protein LarC [Gemmatimonadaceae bacterium]